MSRHSAADHRGVTTEDCTFPDVNLHLHLQGGQDGGSNGQASPGRRGVHYKLPRHGRALLTRCCPEGCPGRALWLPLPMWQVLDNMADVNVIRPCCVIRFGQCRTAVTITCLRCLLEHRLFPTARYSSIVESREGPAARALLQRTSPGAIGLGNLEALLQVFLDRVLGQGRFKVGASGSNRLLSVSVLCCPGMTI